MRLGESTPLEVVRTYNSMPFITYQGDPNRIFARWATKYDTAVSPITLPPAPANGGVSCYEYQDNYERYCVVMGPPIPLPGAPPPLPDAASISRPDGKALLFKRSERDFWPSVPGTKGVLTAAFDSLGTTITGWTYTLSGHSETYDPSGKLLTIKGEKGIERLTYSAGGTADTNAQRYPSDAPVCNGQIPTSVAPGKLMCVTDPWGRQLNFRYGANGQIDIVDPNGAIFQYTKTGESEEALVFPDGSVKKYLFGEPARINGGTVCTLNQMTASPTARLRNPLTGIIDENGNRILSWSYNCAGEAVLTERGVGINKTTFLYGSVNVGSNRNTTVVHFAGTADNPSSTQTSWVSKEVNGEMKHVSQNGQCLECGTIYSRTYNSNGNLTQSMDWAGKVTTYTYNSRNLEISRLENSNDAPYRTISTEWHPTWDVPLRIAVPKLITTLTYDGDGNIISRSEQETTDANGSAGLNATSLRQPLTWDFTYNSNGQLLTIHAPGKEPSVLTSFQYDTMGNLSREVNPLGYTTTYSDYDLNGRVKKVVAPDGRTTQFEYTSRGWLKSRAISTASQTLLTTFEFDATGNQTKRTNPDGSWTHYTYDPAQRLVGMDDSFGNHEAYGLDLIGNVIKEERFDKDGILVGKTVRTYDANGRLQQEVVGGQ